MKQERLLGITTYLLANRSTTAGELADRFGVSARTIYRDLDALSSAGVPVYCNRGAGGGIVLMDDYTLPRLPIEEQEREALFMAIAELAATRHPHAVSAMEKLRALWSRSAEPDWVEVDFTEYGASPSEGEAFAAIRRAILERRVLSFDYYSSKGEHTTRSIEPYKLWFRGRSWYLYGYCRRRRDERLFKVVRMDRPRLSDERFVPREGASLHAFLGREGPRSDRPPLRLKLLFQPRAKYRVLDAYGPHRITEREDGTMEVECSYPEDEWVYGTLLSYGNDVEVLSPPHIREILRERLAKAAAYYSSAARLLPAADDLDP